MEYNTNTSQDDVVLDTPKPGDEGVKPDVASTDDDIMQDIQVLFGEEPSAAPSDEGDPFKDVKDMPRDPQALLQKLQSERDSFRDRYTNAQKEIQEYKPVADFMASLYDDEEAKMAFLGELAPDLVKPKDPLTFIKESLKKEFGDDFTPKNEEAGVLGSQTWLYNEMARDLLADYKAKKKAVPANLKSLADKRKAAKAAAEKALQDQKKEVLEKMKWDENTYNEFLEWGKKTRQVHWAAVYDKARGKKKGPTAPYTATTPGGSPFIASKMKQELDAMFGPN